MKTFGRGSWHEDFETNPQLMVKLADWLRDRIWGEGDSIYIWHLGRATLNAKYI